MTDIFLVIRLICTSFCHLSRDWLHFYSFLRHYEHPFLDIYFTSMSRYLLQICLFICVLFILRCSLFHYTATLHIHAHAFMDTHTHEHIYKQCTQEGVARTKHSAVVRRYVSKLLVRGKGVGITHTYTQKYIKIKLIIHQEHVYVNIFSVYCANVHPPLSLSTCVSVSFPSPPTPTHKFGSHDSSGTMAPSEILSTDCSTRQERWQLEHG